MIKLERNESLKYVPNTMTSCYIDGIVRETEKAVLVDFGDCQHWIPTSACMYGLDDDDEPVIAIQDWKYDDLEL